MIDRQKLIQQFQEMLSKVHRQHTGLGIEVFHRTARKIKFTRKLASTRAGVQTATEQGTAVRLIDRKENVSGFGAASGADEAAVRWALARAERSMRPSGDDLRRRADGTNGPLLDIDGHETLPEAATLRRWLEVVVGTASVAIPSAWIESTLTTEVLVGTDGLSACRTRLRSWAVLTLSYRSGDAWMERPKVVASRGATLALSPGMLLQGQNSTCRDRSPYLVFQPDAAGRLVRTVVRAMNQIGPIGDLEVGPAWNLADDPRMQAGLFGGSFDDTGHPSRSVRLADGKRWTGTLRQAGCFWRGSFRDPPAAMPSNLAISTSNERLPDKYLSLSDLRIFPLQGDRWILEAGEPTKNGSRYYITVNPATFTQRCVSSSGDPVLTSDGVLTPSLVFDGSGLNCRRIS